MNPESQQNCVKCGLCLSVCPVYQTMAQEQASPRARIQLIKFFKEGRLASSEGLKDIISKCLMCGSCAANCPSGIDHYAQFMEMRAQMAEDHGDKPIIKSLVFLLAKEYRIRFAAGFARLGQKLLPKTLAEKYNMGNIPVKQFPKFNRKPLRKAVPGTIPAQGKKKGRVAYFTGCATNYLFDRTGFSTLAILKQMGYEVVIPEKQTCCAIPLLYHGAMDQAQKNVSANVSCLSIDGIEAIVVDCPTCGAALKNEYPALQESFGLDPDKVNKVESKVVDIMTFFRTHAGADLSSKIKESIDVTYHLPCHMKNGLPGMNTTEKVLNELDCVNYIKAEDTDSCCGGGGTFFQEYPELSKQMVDKKRENALQTQARIWLTDCPVCRINLSGNLDKADPIKVEHPAQILTKIYGLEYEDHT